MLPIIFWKQFLTYFTPLFFIDTLIEDRFCLILTISTSIHKFISHFKLFLLCLRQFVSIFFHNSMILYWFLRYFQVNFTQFFTREYFQATFSLFQKNTKFLRIQGSDVDFFDVSTNFNIVKIKIQFNSFNDTFISFTPITSFCQTPQVLPLFAQSTNTIEPQKCPKKTHPKLSSTQLYHTHTNVT